MPFSLKIIITTLFLMMTLSYDISLSFSQTTSPQLFQINKSDGFHLPIKCDTGQNCWVMNYVDIGLKDGVQTDPACYARTYDDHKGTDFAILDNKAMENGVDVIAPMAGIIKKTRDGEPDMWATPEQLDDIREKRIECGNAILIDHGKGLQTIYCHLKKDSIIVKQGQEVKLGQKLGQVGLSGLTQFPHLHFGVMQDGKVTDPFTGQTNKGKCGKRIKSLWHKDVQIGYQPVIIQSSGFDNAIPNLKKLEQNNSPKSKISPDAKILTFWTILLGVRDNDKITIEVRDPDGKVFAEDNVIQEDTRAQQFYYIGKKMRNEPLKEGAYTGLVKINRTLKNGKEITIDKISTVLVIK